MAESLLLPTSLEDINMDQPLTFVVFGASGDLARKKLLPALAQLYQLKLIPDQVNIVMYARSAFSNEDFLAKQGVNVTGSDEQKQKYFSRVTYFQGKYDEAADFARLNKQMEEYEGGGKGNRVFFLSVPPTIFGVVCQCIKAECESKTGYTHIIIEKPFGRDTESFQVLNNQTSSLFAEQQIYRIDHYLGKEVVLNLMTLRFANQMFEPIWNKDNIESVQITFKENLGTGGRGGYFDQFGIVRDIMQNHLLQVFMLVACERPEGADAASISAVKTQLLKQTKTLEVSDVILGQFSAGTVYKNGKEVNEPGYLEDSTVPEGSKCPTFAALHLQVDNPRWKGVPFLMKAGKGLDERMAEVRIIFKANQSGWAAGSHQNELVMRIQPDEAIYLKVTNKVPGLRQKLRTVPLDLNYENAFPDAYRGDAYERMFWNAARGDQSLFVGVNELTESWRIFTPLLKELDSATVAPQPYVFGSRAPEDFDAFANKLGVPQQPLWGEVLACRAADHDKLKELFTLLDKDGSGTLEKAELMELAKMFYDNRDPPQARTDAMVDALSSGEASVLKGGVTWERFEEAAHHLLEDYQHIDEHHLDHVDIVAWDGDL